MRLTTMFLGLLVMLAPVPAPAQSVPVVGRDQESMTYQLSMQKLRKLVEVQRKLNTLNTAKPELLESTSAELAAKAKKKGGSLTAKERAAVLDRYPEMKKVFTGSNWTSRDWVLAGEAMGYAFLAHEVKKGRLSPQAAPPPKTAVQKANIALLEKNQAEWRKIQEELERLSEELE